jgi:hypothetical protein
MSLSSSDAIARTGVPILLSWIMFQWCFGLGCAAPRSGTQQQLISHEINPAEAMAISFRELQKLKPNLSTRDMRVVIDKKNTEWIVRYVFLPETPDMYLSFFVSATGSVSWVEGFYVPLKID